EGQGRPPAVVDAAAQAVGDLVVGHRAVDEDQRGHVEDGAGVPRAPGHVGRDGGVTHDHRPEAVGQAARPVHRVRVPGDDAMGDGRQGAEVVLIDGGPVVVDEGTVGDGQVAAPVVEDDGRHHVVGERAVGDGEVAAVVLDGEDAARHPQAGDDHVLGRPEPAPVDRQV